MKFVNIVFISGYNSIYIRTYSYRFIIKALLFRSPSYMYHSITYYKNNEIDLQQTQY